MCVRNTKRNRAQTQQVWDFFIPDLTKRKKASRLFGGRPGLAFPNRVSAMTEVYHKSGTQTTNDILVFDPTSGQFLLVQTLEPESAQERVDSGSFGLPESASDSAKPGSPDKPESNGDNHNQDSIPGQIKIYSDLAQVVIGKRKEFTRCFVLWSVLRSFGAPGHFEIADVLEIAAQTGKAQSTLYSWLQKGDGIFWHIDKGRLFLVGHYKVFDYFLGESGRPGKVVFVPTNHVLAEKLHVVRANLSSTFVSGDNGRILSRETRTAMSQIPRRTQQTYDKTSDVKVKPIFARAKPKNIQLSNWYGRPVGYTTRQPGRVSKAKFFGHRATDFVPMVTHFDSGKVANGDLKYGYRRYYNDQRKAVRVAEYRKENDIAIPVFWLNPETDSGRTMATWLW